MFRWRFKAFRGAHAASVFALNAGAVSFGQIVKAAEPAFAAFLGVLFYSQWGSKSHFKRLQRGFFKGF